MHSLLNKSEKKTGY